LSSDNEFLKHYRELLHEIKSPVAIIKAHALHLQESYKQDADCIDEYLSVILSETDRLDQLLIDVAAGLKETKLNLSPCDVSSLINDIVSKLKYEFSEKDITVKYDFKGELPKIYLDRGKFLQILINLLKNAVESIESGGTVEILAEVDDQLHISIKDDGCGIKDEDVGKLFTPFFTKKPEGVGLGLFIIKKLVEAHGGSINVSSEYGSGTEFILTFPTRLNVRGDNG